MEHLQQKRKNNNISQNTDTDIDTETDTDTGHNPKLRKQLSLQVCHQQYDDCAVYSIANVFMRKIVLLLRWIGEAINWNETDPNICQQYALGMPQQNETQYKYCILYTFIQRVLRKNFGSCGINGEPALRSFCEAFNRIIENDITVDNITTNINTNDENQVLIAQHRLHIQTLESIIPQTLKTELELNNYKMRLRELTFVLSDPDKIILVTILNEIKAKLDGKVFNITIFVMRNKIDQDIPDPFTDADFLVLKQRFMEGEYGVIGIEFDRAFFNKFQSIKCNTNPRIIDQIIAKVTQREKKRNQLEQTQKLLQNRKLDRDTKKIKEMETILKKVNHAFTIINNELTELLLDYLDLPSGLANSDPSSGEVTMFDTFINMINTPQTAEYGHAAVMQNIFRSSAELDLGDTFLKMKNTYGITWGLDGYIVVPNNIFVYANVIMFDIVNTYEARPSETTYHCSQTTCDNSQYFIIPRIPKTRPLVLGGKQSRKKRKKTKRKKTKRKKCRKTKSRNLK